MGRVGKKGPLQLRSGAVVSVMLDLPSDVFETDGLHDSFLWDDAHGSAQFEVTCLRGAEPRRHVLSRKLSERRRSFSLRAVSASTTCAAPRGASPARPRGLMRVLGGRGGAVARAPAPAERGVGGVGAARKLGQSL